MLAAATAALRLSATLTAAAPTSTPSGLDLAAIDRSVAPGDDFFRYANGAWLAQTEIPADRSSFGVGPASDELTRKRTVDLIQGRRPDRAGGTPTPPRWATYYAAYHGRGEHRERWA